MTASEEAETVAMGFRLLEEAKRLLAENAVLKADAIVMKAALRHYAEEKQYFPRGIVLQCQKVGVRLAPIYSDFGSVAKIALASLTTKET